MVSRSCSDTVRLVEEIKLTSFLLLVSELREGVDDDSENDIQGDDVDDDKEGELVDVFCKEPITERLRLHRVSDPSSVSEALVDHVDEAGG